MVYVIIVRFFVWYGLYFVYLGCFIYCVFGGSKDVIFGLIVIMLLMVVCYVNGFLLLVIVVILFCGII